MAPALESGREHVDRVVLVQQAADQEVGQRYGGDDGGYDAVHQAQQYGHSIVDHRDAVIDVLRLPHPGLGALCGGCGLQDPIPDEACAGMQG